MKHHIAFTYTPVWLRGVLLGLLVFSTSDCVRQSGHDPFATQVHIEPRTVESGLRININTASAQEIEKLPGIGVGLAARIVAHRQQYGPFRRAEHLMMVRGISDRKFREIRQMIVVE